MQFFHIRVKRFSKDHPFPRYPELRESPVETDEYEPQNCETSHKEPRPETPRLCTTPEKVYQPFYRDCIPMDSGPSIYRTFIDNTIRDTNQWKPSWELDEKHIWKNPTGWQDRKDRDSVRVKGGIEDRTWNYRWEPDLKKLLWPSDSSPRTIDNTNHPVGFPFTPVSTHRQSLRVTLWQT